MGQSRLTRIGSEGWHELAHSLGDGCPVRLIAIDPGRHIGYALADCGSIVAAGTVSDLAEIPYAPIAIIEMPRVYPNPGKWRGDPQDIVKLALLAGQIAARFRHVIMVEPVRWRGGRAPKNVIRKHTQSRLHTSEWQALANGRISTHAWDAIGILCWALRRPFQSGNGR